MKSILVANLAGGVGKTITVASLATAMTEYGKSVLAIDADPNASLTFLLGIENPRFTSREFLRGESSLEMTALKSYDRFSVVPSSSRLANWEPKLDEGLRNKLADFDVVLIDSSTATSALLPNLIELADLVIAPVTRDLHSIRGALNLKDFVRSANSEISIKLLDIALQDWDLELRSSVDEEFGTLEPAISRFDGEYSGASGRSLLSEAPRSQAATDYREIAYLLLEEFGLF